MKKEIIDFYADKGLHISKMINRRPCGVSPEQIEEGAELIYYDIQSGRQLKNIQIASEVFRTAKNVTGEKYAQEKALLENSKEIIQELEKQIKFLKGNSLRLVEDLIQQKDIIRKGLEKKNRRLKIYLIITLTVLLISEFIWIWPYIKILLRGL